MRKKLTCLLVAAALLASALCGCISQSGGEETEPTAKPSEGTVTETVAETDAETDTETDTETETKPETESGVGGGTQTPSRPSEGESESGAPTPIPPLVDGYDGMSHSEISDDLYDRVLGEFEEYYQRALAATDVSERYALMAIAEAKLLQTGVMLPSIAQGGNYAISRVAPYSVPSVLWGNDSDRFYTAIIVNEDPLTPAIRDEMKAKWATCTTAAEYLAWAKEYLAGKGMTISDTYTLGYSSDPWTWDVLATSDDSTIGALVNTYDGLMEYDAKNNQVPALAESYTVSEDGLTYTFKLREGVQWVTHQGAVIEEVTADSFVAGFQHMLDAAGGLEYLVQGVVVNADEYINGVVTDFSEVGVKAVDRYTVSYTLCQPTSYFMTMLGYNIFAPMSRAFYLSKGGVFGVDAYDEAVYSGDYTYGYTPLDIAYCGPYLVRSAVAENFIVFEMNDNYWNRDNVQIKTLSWKFISGWDATESYDLVVDGVFAGAGLNSDSVAKAKRDGYFDLYAYTADVDATTFPIFLNLYRAQYGNYNDEAVAPSTLTEVQKDRANIAMQNQHFRLALVTALDRGPYNATLAGDELKYTSLVNSYTPGNFVKLEQAVTVRINGQPKTYPAGTYYGQIMQDQLDADGIRVTVWDPDANEGIGSSVGFDGWYNVEYCRENLALAIGELRAQGVEITRANPLVLELPYYDISESYTNHANALKQSIEASTEGLIEIRLVKCGGEDAYNWYYATYFPNAGDDMNYNIADNSGWGPDYGDPSTYLDSMIRYGYMTKCIGLY